jgi:hypothetical protein
MGRMLGHPTQSDKILENTTHVKPRTQCCAFENTTGGEPWARKRSAMESACSENMVTYGRPKDGAHVLMPG